MRPHCFDDHRPWWASKANISVPAEKLSEAEGISGPMWSGHGLHWLPQNHEAAQGPLMYEVRSTLPPEVAPGTRWAA